jgi:transglutaminase-like putative cysteine protease
MKLQVRHQTAYRYSQPITYAIQTLRLTPRPHDGLAVNSWRVRGEGRNELPAFTDGFGNLAHCHTVNRIHDHAVITVEGEVETHDTGGAVKGVHETLPPLFFLRWTALTSVNKDIEQLAVDSAKGGKLLDRLDALMEGVRRRVDYRTGVTDTMTTAAEALAAGGGVCQDHAHLFIAAARSLGIPARYVGGYLWTGKSDQEYEASHAWAEAYADDLGWIGFDPSNRTRPTEAYIRTATGLDYWSAAPIRGVWRGEADEDLTVKVRVQPPGSGGDDQQQ